ncbi:MAG: hypothetical protein JWN67_5016 [Actinomycetia bacterium]|nr:hypothetical protein [Actinomycetes bacterium]
MAEPEARPTAPHVELCSADDCPCFLSGEESARREVAESAVEAVVAARQFVAALGPEVPADGPAGSRVQDLMDNLAASVEEARAARARARFGQCDSTCTVDCGHCKGEGPTAGPEFESLNAGPAIFLTDANGTIYRLQHAGVWDPPEGDDRSGCYFEDDHLPVGAVSLYRVDVAKDTHA